MSNHLPMIEAGARACFEDVSSDPWDSLDEPSRGPWLRLSLAVVEFAAAAMKAGADPEDAAAFGMFVTATNTPPEDRLAVAEAWTCLPEKTRRPWEEGAEKILSAARDQVRREDGDER